MEERGFKPHKSPDEVFRHHEGDDPEGPTGRCASERAVESETSRICSVAVPAIEENPNDLDKCYNTVLLEALVARSVEQRDRESLVRLLSHNCPQCAEHLVPLEFYLEDTWRGSITAMFDAYEKALSERAKKELIFCIGQAFASLRTRSVGDDALVKAAKARYTEHQAHLKLNVDYPHLPGRPAQPIPQKQDLFLPTDA